MSQYEQNSTAEFSYSCSLKHRNFKRITFAQLFKTAWDILQKSKPVVLNLFWPMDHLFKEISNGTLCYADTSWTTSRSCIAHRWSYIIRKYSKAYNFSKHVINDWWNSLQTTRNSRWTTGGLVHQTTLRITDLNLLNQNSNCIFWLSIPQTWIVKITMPGIVIYFCLSLHAIDKKLKM